MKNPFISLARFFSLARHRSKIPHDICPLSKCKKACVLIDGKDKSAQSCVDEVNAFFSERKLACKVFVIDERKEAPVSEMKGARMILRKNIKWYGRAKRSNKYPYPDGAEDILVNLLPEDNFTAYYASVCSQARFKVGIYQSGKKPLFDLLITNTQNFSQKQIFTQISQVLNSIV